MDITIRPEKEYDYRIVEELTREAFWNLYFPGCVEHYLAHILRNHPDFIAEMDYVAEVDNKVVGNIMYTKSYVTDEDNHKIETITFGPLSVLPEYQKKGIGSSLIQYTKEIAVKNNSKAIINQKVLPFPSSLSNPISPPINSTNCFASVMPSPDPPYLLVT